jgi:hypothetical protein
VGDDDEIGFLEILDLTQPIHPRRVGSTPTASYARGVAVAGQFAYVVGESVVLTVVDVSNPTRPMPISEFHTRGWGQSVQIVGHRAYLGLPDPGLFVVDINKPEDPFRLAEYRVGKEDESCDLHVIGNRVYVARGSSGLLVFEITGLPDAISVTRLGSNLMLAWQGAPGVKLQRTPSLTAPNWTDVAGSEGQSHAALPIGAGNEFFRLVRP